MYKQISKSGFGPNLQIGKEEIKNICKEPEVLVHLGLVMSCFHLGQS